MRRFDLIPRRELRGTVAGLAAPSTRQIVVAETLSNTNYWQLSGSSDLNGSSMMTVGVVMRAEGATLGRNVTLFRKWLSATRGYTARLLNGPNRGNGIYINGVPANASKNSGTVTLAASSFYTHVTRLNTAVGIDVFWQGVKSGLPTACAAYTPASSTEDIRLGWAESSGSAVVGVAAVVVAESTAVSDANVTAWHSQVAAGNNWAFPGGGTTHVWYAGDISGSNWASQVGSVTLAQQGSPTVATYTSPVFP